MASTAEMVGGVRAMLRDFPQFFETEAGPLNTMTIRLPHPLIQPQSLQVYTTVVDETQTPPQATSTPTNEWQLDERNGLLKLTNQGVLGQRVLIAGYHFIWFADSDIVRQLGFVNAEFAHGGAGDPACYTDVVSEVAQMGTVVRLLWSLLVELALDIDVSTPEGMFIPAHQRYSQVLGMMQYWEQEYNNKASALNLGLNALEIFRLRRIAYTTGRYVPVYQEREIDDPRWPKRLYPPIPDNSLDPHGSTTAEWEESDECEVEEATGLFQEAAGPVTQRTTLRSTTGFYPAVTYPGFLGRGD